MTTRAIPTVEPGDVIALELQCGKCQTKVSVPIAKVADGIPNTCPVCTAKWTQRGKAEHDHLVALADALKQLGKFAGERVFAVRLELPFKEEK